MEVGWHLHSQMGTLTHLPSRPLREDMERMGTVSIIFVF